MNIEWIQQQERQYKVSVLSLQTFLEQMQQRYVSGSMKPPPDNCIVPDRAYVEQVLRLIESLAQEIEMFELNQCRNEIEKLLYKDDFDSLEDTMESLHGVIKKYIYDSDTKVTAEEWQLFSDFLLNAGYQKVDVKVGDPIEKFKTSFYRPVAASGGKKGTIKQIQLMPYTLTFLDNDGEIQIQKLCGKCTYYK